MGCDSNNPKPEAIAPPKNEKEISKNNVDSKPIQPSSKIYALPQQLDYSSKIPNDFCLSANEDHCHIEKIYPLGWSEDGKFAYVSETSSFGVNTHLELIVRDLTEDKDIVSERWADEYDDFPNFWKSEQSIIAKTITQHTIIPSNTFELFDFPYDYQGISYSPKLSTSHYDSGAAKNQKLIIQKSDGASKQIFSEEHEDFEFGLRKSKVIGYMKSPIEPRIAVMVLDEIKAMENDVYLRISIIGCHIEKGFK